VRETVQVQEAGLTFLATPEAGQKTGAGQAVLPGCTAAFPT
jgi:hypothetical protein